MKKLAFAALASGLLMGTAHAADLIVSDPVVDVAADVYDWNGFYAGVVGGWGSSTITYSNTAGGTPFELGGSGWLIGGTLGYNHQWDMFVLGVEGDVAFANIGAGQTAVPGGGTIGYTINGIATLRGRAGVAFDQALLYVTAGVAGANVASTSVFAGVTRNANTTHVGWVAGVGAEYAVTDDWSIKAEYNYVDLGVTNDGGALVPPASGTINVDPRFQTVKIGANFHF